MKFSVYFFIMISSLLLNGCMFKHSEAYHKTTAASPLVLPEHLKTTQSSGKKKYAVPAMIDGPRYPNAVPPPSVRLDADHKQPISKTIPATVLYIGYDGNHAPFLHMNRDFQRAWSLLGYALKQSKIHVEDYLRNEGIYHIGPIAAMTQTSLQIHLNSTNVASIISIQSATGQLISPRIATQVLEKLKRSIERKQNKVID